MTRRLPCNTVDLTILASDAVPATATSPAIPAIKGHKLAMSLAYDHKTGLLREVVFVGRGKIGHGIDAVLHELGIKISRAIQGRDPDTGKQMGAGE